MAEKKYRGAPFGVQTARFDVSGVHPKFKPPGGFTELPYDKNYTNELTRCLGPGCYSFDNGSFSKKRVEEMASGPGWQQAYEVERMAALPHLLYKEQWEQKRMLRRKLGPGSYEIKDFMESADEKPRSQRGICDARAERFSNDIVSITPGPGTYGKGGVPSAVIEEKQKKSMSTVGMLDAVSSAARYIKSQGSGLGPGTYHFNSFTDDMASKVVSLRGPYDLFSGNRNKPITVGYFAAPKMVTVGPGKYELKSFVDDWQTLHKKKHGKFGNVEQYPDFPHERIFYSTLSQYQTRGNTPGPGKYDVLEQPSKPTSVKGPGFLSSSQRNDRMSQMFFTRNFNPVGAGRYDIQKWDDAQHHNGHESVFKSKTGPLKPHMAKFQKERIRAKDVQIKDRLFMVPPQTEDYSYMNETQSRLLKPTRSTTVI
ncbi:lymphocyte expansion molecule-like [Gigantopelta aegis]|uniref:lymphocyte expansion molecule-like n=1 Tax=Gigantopelta aegis TaxID=1735272 RepID=UPI001B88809E|nr:lymphocyte expansion molecule-like [Gigantopelta aegis]